MLNQDSGMKGLCGTNDFREILQNKEEGNEEAEMALELYCYRVRKTIGSFNTVIGPVDALVFTGGVGENVSWVRKRSVRGMEWMNIQLDPDMNDYAEAPCARFTLKTVKQKFWCFAVMRNGKWPARQQN